MSAFGVELEVDLVDRGLGAPVGGVLGQEDVAAPLPLLDLEGPGTDEGVGDLVLLGLVDLGPDVLGDAVDVEPLHVGLGRAAAHLAGVVVDRHRLVDELGVGAVRVELLLDDVVVAEGHIPGGHGLAVAPHGALADLERPHQAVVGHLPALGDTGHRLAVEAVADDVVVVEAPRLVVDRAVTDERVEVVGRLCRADPEDDRLAAGGRRRAVVGGEGGADAAGERRRHQEHDAEGEVPRQSRSGAV